MSQLQPNLIPTDINHPSTKVQTDQLLAGCKARVEPLRVSCAIRTESAALLRAAALLRDVGTTLEALIAGDFKALPEGAPVSLHVAPRTNAQDVTFAKKVRPNLQPSKCDGKPASSKTQHAPLALQDPVRVISAIRSHWHS